MGRAARARFYRALVAIWSRYLIIPIDIAMPREIFSAPRMFYKSSCSAGVDSGRATTDDSFGDATSCQRPSLVAPGDTSRNRPLRWTQRYELVLRLYLAGWRTSEIAAELRYSPHRVSMIINSALFEERKATVLRELSGKSRGPYLDAVERDAAANFEFLRDLRDDETQPVHERLRAAQSIARLADLVLPRGGRG